MSKNNILCNNCGKNGHLFHQCKLPITSYGIILSRSSGEGLQFLMIRRKDSFGYIDFIRGKYSPYNIDQVQNCINEMSIQEKERILEIQKYLELHPEITHWVAIDDLNMSPEENQGHGLKNFVLTPRSNEGIKQSGIKEKLINYLI
jgi:hypothetical protein